jgi:glycosyltransferase involved in cell wall biosynthesis
MNQMSKIPCTIYIMTLNAGPDFRRCLESVQEFDDILVTDGNSTDGTPELARRYGARVIKQTNSDQPNVPIEDFAAVQNHCIAEAHYDWVFQLDMDEVMRPELVAEIRDIVSRPTQYWAYLVSRKIVYKGRVIRYSGAYPGYEMKFFNRTSGCRVIRSPHHRLDFDQTKFPVGYLKNYYYVYHSAPAYNEGKNYPKRFLNMEIREVRKQTWPQFLYWTVLLRSLKIIKKLLKFVVFYARHGFRETFPPSVEFGNIQYSWLIMIGAILERISGNYHHDTR